mgnify:FL=1
MKNISPTDSELIAFCINGDERAFNILLERYQQKIYNIIKQIVKDPDLADDLRQETFIKALRTIRQGNYNEEGKFYPWLSRIAHNLAIDHFRREQRYPTVEIEENRQVANSLNFSEESIEAARMREEVHNKVRQLIQTLPEKQREVVMMRHYAEMSFQEIAHATDVSINTALGRMRYALINLRKKAEEYNINFGEQFMAYSA